MFIIIQKFFKILSKNKEHAKKLYMIMTTIIILLYDITTI